MQFALNTMGHSRTLVLIGEAMIEDQAKKL
jgi:hypothetical protein